MFNSIQGRLTILIISLAVIPMLLIGGMLTYRSFQTQQQQAEDLRVETAGRLSNEIESFLAERARGLTVLVELRGLTALEDTAAQQVVLADMLSFDLNLAGLTLLDGTGHETVQVLRNAVVTGDELQDRSDRPEFTEALSTREIYYSPVRFDPVSGEPLMTISLPVFDLRTGQLSTVIVADFRLKAIWDLFAAQDFATGEDAYLVSGTPVEAGTGDAVAEGRVIAHRNPSVMLGGTTFDTRNRDTVRTGLSGDQVVLAQNQFSLGGQTYIVVSELTTDEAFKSAYETLTVIVVGGILVLVLSAGLGYLALRQVTRPLADLTLTAEQIGAGNFSVQADATRRTEIGVLARALNAMSGQIRELVGSLEQRVQARTEDLFLTLEVGQLATRIAQQSDLLPRVTAFIHERFDLYYAQVYLLDDAARYAVLTAGTTEVGRQLLERGHKLDLRETSIVARAAQTRRSVLVENTEESDFFRPNPLLPDTRSEVAVPLIVGDTVLGVLDLQTRETGSFTTENLPVFEAMASSVASALRSAQSFETMQSAMSRADLINRRLTTDSWESYLGRVGHGERVGYQYNLQSVQPVADFITSGGEAADHENGRDGARLALPITLRNQPIGTIQVKDEPQRQWTPEEKRLIVEVAEQVAQVAEQFRAFDETNHRARDLQTVAEVSAAASSTLDVDQLLWDIVNLTKDSFGLYHAHIYLLDEDGDTLALAAGAGDAGRMMVAQGRGIALNHAHSLVARAARTREGVIANNVADTPDFLPNPLLPQTQSELAIPLLAGNDLIGVLDVQSERAGHFTNEDVRIQTTLATQVAIAVQNARLFTESAQRLAILENSDRMVALVTLEGQGIYINPAGARMLGLADPKDVVQRAIPDFSPPETLPQVQGEIIPAVMQTGYWRGESLMMSLDGTIIPVDQTLFLIRDEGGQPQFIATLANDITERLAAQEEIESQRRTLEAMLENLPVGVFMADAKTGTPLLANQMAIEMLGRGLAPNASPDELAEVYAAFRFGTDEPYPTDQMPLVRGMYGERVQVDDMELRRPDGTNILLQVLGAPVQDAAGNVTSSLAVFQDITERRAAEEERARLLAETQQMYEASARITRAETPYQLIAAVVETVNVEAINRALLFDFEYDQDGKTQAVTVISNWYSGTGHEPTPVGTRYDLEEFPVMRLTISEEPVFFDDLIHDERTDPALRAVAKHQSVMAVAVLPLWVGSRQIGSLFLETEEIHEFTEQEVQPFTALAGQMAVALDGLRLLEQTAKRASEMETVAQVSAEASSQLDVERLLWDVADLTKQRFNLYHAHIYLLDETETHLVLAAGAGDVGRQMAHEGRSIPLDHETSVVARAARTRAGVVENNLPEQPDFLANPLLPDTKSEMAIPMIVGNRLIGVLDVQSQYIGRFTDEDVRIQTTLTAQIAVAVQNARSFAETQLRVRDLQVINQVADLIRAEDELEPLLERVVDLMVEAFGADTGAITRLDQAKQTWTGVVGGTTGLTTDIVKTFNEPAGVYPNGLDAVRTEDVVASNDVSQYPNFPPEYVKALGLKSVIVLPLDHTPDYANVLYINYVSDFHTFTPEEINLARSLADQVSVGVEAKQAEAAIQRYAAEMATVAELGTEAAQSLSLTQLLQTMSDQTKERFNLYHAHIYLLDTVNNVLTLAAGAGQVGRMLVDSGHRIPANAERSVVAQAARTGESVVINNVAQLPNFLPNPMLPQTKAEMAIPLITGEKVIGVLDVQANRVDSFTRQDMNVMTILASQIAAAVNNAQLFAESEEQARRLAMLNEMAAEMSAATSVNDVHKIVAHWTKTITGSDRVSLTLLTPDSSGLEVFALDGVKGAIPVGAMLPIKGTAVGDCLSQREVLVINDLKKSDYLEAPQLAEQGLRSSANAPVIMGEVVIGTLNMGSARVQAYNERDEALLTQVASLLASHMQNQQLLEQTQIALSETEQLYDASRRITDANTAQDLLAAVAESVRIETINRAHLFAFERDEDGEVVAWRSVANWHSGQGMPPTPIGTRMESTVTGDRANEVLARTSFINDTLEANLPGVTPETHARFEQLNIRSMGTIPLFAGGRQLGLLVLEGEEPHTFTEEETQPLTVLAGQVAVALDSLQLLEQTQKRAAEMQAVAEVGAEASSSLDPTRLLKNVANLTRDRFDLYHAHIYLYDPAQNMLRLAVGAGDIGDQMVEAGHRIPINAARSVVAETARTRQPVIVNDVKVATGFLPNPLLPNTRSEMAVPMIAGDTLIGVLDVQSDKPGRFAEEDRQVQSTLAYQVAVAIRNAQLYAEQVKTAEQLREVDRLKSEFLASMSHELRTPLNSIIGYAEVMLDGIDGELTDDMEEDVGAIHGSGKHLLNLINDVLDLAKIEAGQMDLVSEDFDFVEVAQDMVNTSKVLLKDKPVELVVEVSEDLPQAHGDVLRIRQVINNILSNAIKFTEQGNVTIGARRYEEDPSMMLAYISDTGIGLTPEQINVIFDRFRQVDQSHTRRAGGTGLGLSITQQLIEMHGGKIWVRSDYGTGSTFYFTLPLAQESGEAG
ncbi:MAG: GAF domain-containing protein [Anaerolineae bacterium]|nr:GAF domain-containing protein [Anaerolineae bacterium]